MEVENDITVDQTSQNPEGPSSSPRLGSHGSSLISIEHAELMSIIRSIVGAVLCLASNHCIACALLLGDLSPLPTSGDDE